MKHFVIIIVILLGTQLAASSQWMPPNSPTMAYTWKSEGDLCDYLFLGIVGSFSPPPARPTNLILDRKGDIVWYQQSAFSSFDFKIHPGGQMSFYYRDQWYLLDSTFAVSDTLACLGYTTDLHDLLLTEDGHAHLICIDDTTMDLSGINTRDGMPGDPAGTVRYHLVQELDATRNVVREWHAIDHFDLEDHDTTFFIDPERLQLNHTNSISLDQWGNMLISHRYNHELTYINWASGEIIWRLGGANNQFTFVNDIGLNSQHFGQIMPNGQVSVYDNGNYHDPRRARGIVYTLDTVAMTATKAWEFANPDIISSALGSFQVLPNGDRLVNFGTYSPHVDPNVVYLRSDSTVVLEIKFEDLYWTYRAQCLPIPFVLERPRIECTEQNGQLILSADTIYGDYRWTNGATTASIAVTDTGRYQLFVPRGLGMMGSETVIVRDLNQTCRAVSTPEPQANRPREPKLLRTLDLQGRTVRYPVPGRLYIELYDNGQTRKVIRR
ncbi:MAG: aryl-sulfate sulfotransferase [Bacteroidota bacterium]